MEFKEFCFSRDFVFGFLRVFFFIDLCLDFKESYYLYFSFNFDNFYDLIGQHKLQILNSIVNFR